MSQANLCALAGMRPNRMSAFFVGSGALENEELKMLHDILVSCEKLAELARPIPVDFKNLLALREALEALRLDDLRPINKHADVATA